MKMFLRALSLSVFLLSALFSKAQIIVPTLPTSVRFNTLEVIQKSLFEGEIELDSSLNIVGFARFQDSIKTLGSIDVGQFLTVRGIAPTTEFDGELLFANPAGQFLRMPLGLLITQLKQVPGFTEFQTVNIGGALNLGDTTTITGDALFEGGITTNGDLYVHGNTHLITELNNDPTRIAGVLVKNINGQLEEVPLPNFGPLIPGYGDEDDTTLVPCRTGPNGEPEPQKARWTYTNDYIYTSECTPDVKVGLGTITPRERLDIAGNLIGSGWIRMGRNVPTGANNQLRGNLDVGNTTEYLRIGHDGSHSIIESYAPLNNQANNPHLHINYNNNNGVIIGGNSDILTHKSFLKVGGNGYFADRLMVGSTTEEPAAALHINSPNAITALLVKIGADEKFKVSSNGVAYAREVVIKMGVFPDYVFKPGYQILTLADVKAHISKYGRLPKMPSAEIVAKNGAELGEVTRLLVEKVEELTIYTIQLEEARKKHEEQNRILEERIKALEKSRH